MTVELIEANETPAVWSGPNAKWMGIMVEPIQAICELW